VQTQEQALLERHAVEVLPGRDTFEDIRKPHAQVGFLEHIEQTGHGPAVSEFRFQCQEIHRFWLRFQGGKCDPTATLR
jgi:hypothetical protein